MSDIKFSQLTQITNASSLDLVPIIDVSNALMSENGSNAIVSVGDLTSSFFNGLGNGSISSTKIQTSPEFFGNVKLPITTSIGPITGTEIGFLTGLRNNIQYQLDNPVYSGTLTLGPGTTAGAPLKIVAGTNTTTPIAGNIEFDGTSLYYTNNDPTPARQTLATTTYVDSIIDGAPIISYDNQTDNARTLANDDVGGYIRYTGANVVNFTVPSTLLVVSGSVITFRRATGAGVITLTAGASVTINDNGATSIAAGKTFSIKCIDTVSTTKVWDFID